MNSFSGKHIELAEAQLFFGFVCFEWENVLLHDTLLIEGKIWKLL